MNAHSPIKDRVAENWNRVLSQITAACENVRRDPATVRVVGVSKYVDAATTQSLIDAGCRDVGESRPQMLWQKAAELSVPDSFRWHMIGHVQTNKLRRLLRYRPLIHSVDSERLLRAIDQESRRQDFVTEVLLEVNISGDENKTGMSDEELERLIAIDDLPNARIRGLMAMAGWGTDAEQAESQFRRVARLRDALAASTGRPLDELSMGMSGDFAQAIAAGATLVRIGSALFEGVR